MAIFTAIATALLGAAAAGTFSFDADSKVIETEESEVEQDQ